MKKYYKHLKNINFKNKKLYLIFRKNKIYEFRYLY